MADGSYRFQQPGAGQYYYPQHNQHTSHQRHLGRNASPGTSGRIKYNNDTPSPSRSPVSQSPAPHSFGMYNQGHQGQQHGMNGQGQQRYGLPMNMPPKFQHHNHHPHQAQHHAHHHAHNQGGHSGHSGTISHQHSYSGGLTNATPHFTPSQLQNGGVGTPQDSMDEHISEHYQQQLQLAEQARNAVSPHHYARAVAQANKGVIQQQGTNNGGKRDDESDERHRPGGEEPKPRQDWMALDFGAQGLRALSIPLFSYTFLDKLYLNNNRLKALPSAIGKLRNLTHLDVSCNQLSYLPPEIGMLVGLKSLLLIDNDLRELPFDLGSLHNLDMLGIEGNPLEDDSMERIKAEGTRGLIQFLREENPGPDPPNDREWRILDDTSLTSGPSPDKFTVLSYNILADRYCTTALYGYSPSRVLAWENRKELIMRELKSYDADIMCLQEVDVESFNEFFRVQLAYDDYKGVFWPKSRARTMAEKEAKMVDGCATFYKHEKYILLDKQMIDFQHLAINRPDMKGEQDVFNRVMPRDHIAVITFFENRATGTRLIVVNAHIEWNPALRDVKLVQVAILMEQVTKMAEKYSKLPPLTDKVAFRVTDPDAIVPEDAPPPIAPAPSKEYTTGSSIPLLICGDFNSKAGSGVYDFFSHGTLASDHSDLATRNYGSFTRDGITHPFALKSAYANIGELSFTNYTPGFIDVIDYIWYSTNALQVTKLLGDVDKEYLQRVPGFPNQHYPSDHLALLSEFQVKGKKVGKVVEADFGPKKEDRR